MNGLISQVLHRSRTVIMILMLVLVASAYSYTTIPKESSPDIPIPVIYVNMVHEGISPEDAERLLIRPIENELRAIEGVKEMTATATEGQASVTLEFEAGFDNEKALNDVREKVDLAKAELPEETEEPTVHEINLALFPVIVITLSGDVPERSLVKLARDLKDKIEGISEVLEVEIGGNREEVVEIVVDPIYLDTYDLRQEHMFALAARNNKLVAAGTMDSGTGRIAVKVPGLFETVDDILNLPMFALAARNNKLVAAGTMDSGTGRIAVKVPGLFETVDDILNLPIKVKGDKVIRVSDVATIRKTFKDAAGFARVGGRPAVTLEVKKRPGENVIGTTEKVRALIASESANWPQAIEVGFTQDQSKDIRRMLSDLQNNMISAITLVMIVVVASLGVRTGALVGIAIPGSFLAGILVLHLMGMTVNIVVLFSLILAVGMLVDGAIVVTEFADRKMNEGHPRGKAYLMASQRMALPIIASTATTLAAFMPLLFWPGTVGEFMKFLPITLIATLSASLLMALVFIPTLGSLWGKPGPADPRTMKSLAAAEGGDIDAISGFTGWYVRRLRGLLKHPSLVVCTALASLIGAFLLYAKIGRGVEFFPEIEPERAALLVRLRGNLSISEIDLLVREVENRILDVPGIRSMYVRSGTALRGENLPEDVHGIIQLEFAEWDQRPKASVILADIRERVAELAGIVIQEREEEHGPPTGKPIQIQLASRFPELIEPALAKVREKLESFPGVKDIDDSRAVPGLEWVVDVNRVEASRFGADVTLVGNAIQFITNGLKLGSYRPHDVDDEVDIRVRYPRGNRHLDQIERLRVNTAYGLVPIKHFVTWKPAPKVGMIDRSNSRRMLQVSANMEEGVLPDSIIQDETVVGHRSATRSRHPGFLPG